ncbi:hypothetical protein T440DRAFT_510703 [Plenodomus tracheiphilus IPT5]|uniref:Uncharacterized protein n=1 Tax=Plenodomus tracheiphilus IPT5 TaxID=1408161 RepID=A0A6A7AUH8_9PLEO|nr:hypothetical protein T440DRAFT_510703 [Plenodomus tracheiphilus IPT5]
MCPCHHFIIRLNDPFVSSKTGVTSIASRNSRIGEMTRCAKTTVSTALAAIVSWKNKASQEVIQTYNKSTKDDTQNGNKMSLPLLFTLPPSNRHEFITLDTTSKPTLKALNKLITSTIAESPNCAEFMAKHKSADTAKETIQQLRMHWDTKTRDGKIWPEYTVVTDENFGAILELLKGNPVMGVLEVKVGKDE